MDPLRFKVCTMVTNSFSYSPHPVKSRCSICGFFFIKCVMSLIHCSAFLGSYSIKRLPVKFKQRSVLFSFISAKN